MFFKNLMLIELWLDINNLRIYCKHIGLSAEHCGYVAGALCSDMLYPLWEMHFYFILEVDFILMDVR